MHLGDAKHRADLALLEVGLEAQAEYLPAARGQVREVVVQQHGVLDRGELAVICAEQLAEHRRPVAIGLWDLAFLAFGVVLLAVGVALSRAAPSSFENHRGTDGPRHR